MVELRKQICIYKCIEAKVPISYELPISSARRPIPRSSSSISSRVTRPRTSGAGILQLGVIGDPDPEPGRCRRTDGKKWRCSKGAVANHKYCDRHLNRGRHHSRKLVEGHASRAARLVLSNAHLPTASSEYGAGSSYSLSIAQLPGESFQLGIPNFPPMQLNRMQMSEHNANIRAGNSQDLSMLGSELHFTNTLFPILTGPAPFENSQDLSMQGSELHSTNTSFPISTGPVPFENSQDLSIQGSELHSTNTLFPISTGPVPFGNAQDLSIQGSEVHSTNEANTSFPISTGPAPFAGSSSLPPLLDSVLASEDPLLNLPTRSFLENTTFLPSFQMSSEVQKSIHALSSQPHAEYHGILNAPSELSSCSSSPFPENLMLSPLNLSGDLDSFGVGQGIRHGQNVMNWDPIAWAASVGGPLGEVLANYINMPSEEMNNSLYSDLTTGEWDLSPRF